MAAKKAGVARKGRRRSRSRIYADEFLNASKRARELHERLVSNGYAVKNAGEDPRPLSQPDRRDISEYLFFEVAAKFEQFAQRTLVLEVQKKLRVNRSRAEHMVGSSEEGIPIGMGGWADVAKMQKRATGLLGKNAVYARVSQHLGNPRTQYLQMAVTTRNRIGHGKGNKKFIEMLGKVPVRLRANERQGVSPGLFLVEYPRGAHRDDKWFFRFLEAYETWVKLIRRRI